jgi:uncharacterized protein (DUF934 family)
MSEPTPLLAPTKPQVIAQRLWDGSHFIADKLARIAYDEALPTSGAIFVTLTRWRSDRMALKCNNLSVGVQVLPVETVEIERDEIDQLQIIALTFPKFTDGRPYSSARRLREARYGGDIRAIGDILIDQLPLMLRAGFTSFQIENAATVRFLETSKVPAISRVYQTGSELAAHTWHSRRIADADKMAIATAKRVI